MALTQYTQRSLEALQTAQRLAAERNNQQLEQMHLFRALLDQETGLIWQLITKLGADAKKVKEASEYALDRLPKVQYTAREQGKVYVSPKLDECLRKAADIAEGMKDEYISVEHFLQALLETADRDMSALLQANHIEKDQFLRTLAQVRGATRVTSDSPEDTYDALKKYGSDLVDLARKNKLDPVIGRDSEIRDVIRILSRKTKNNPVLIGEPGVGKTAIA